LLAAIVVCNASAQIQPQWVLLADGELAFPVSGPDNFTDRYSSVGWGGGAGLGAILSDAVMVIVMLNYTYVGVDEDGFRKVEGLPGDASFDGGAVNIIYTSFGARYNLLKNPPAHSKPYVVGGVGWYYVKSDDLTLDSSLFAPLTFLGRSENAFGLNVGAGSDFPISDTVNAFVEVQYQVGFTSDGATATIPVRGGFVFLLGNGG
jgi:outer membrane autotransporter protein